jgi:hypothetical protein
LIDHTLQDLGVQLTDDADPFFLYTLQLSLEDFSRYVKAHHTTRTTNLVADSSFTQWRVLLSSTISPSCARVLPPPVATDPPILTVRWQNASLTRRQPSVGTARLRQSQNLKVDFAAFPSNLVQLVDKCGRRNTDQTYILELDTPASDASSCAVLSVVETNSFKNLVHLSLRLIPGTDCTVKKHLAGCLIARKIEESRLRDELAETTRDLTTRLQRATDEGVAAAAEAATLRVEVATVTTRLRNDHCTELARVQRETLEAQTAAHEERRRATQDADGAAATIVADLRRQVTELTASDTAKAAQVFELEGALRDTRARLTSSEASATANQTELDTARNEIRGLRTAAHEYECTLNEARIRVAELTQEVSGRGWMLRAVVFSVCTVWVSARCRAPETERGTLLQRLQVKGKTELEAQQASLISAATEQKTAVEVTARQLEARCAIAEKRSQRSRNHPPTPTHHQHAIPCSVKKNWALCGRCGMF